jgi:hypothetical protein
MRKQKTVECGYMKQKRNKALTKNLLAIAGVALGLVAVAWNSYPALAAAADPGQLCTLAVQMDSPDRCGSVGASAARVQYWEQGLYPRRPFAAIPIDGEKLGALDRGYAIVSKDFNLPLFSSIQDAVDNNPVRTMEKGTVYISFTDVFLSSGGKVLLTGDKYFVRRNDVSPLTVQYRQFSGVEFTETPDHAFGWVLYARGSRPSRVPGGSMDTTLPLYNWHAMVEVFDMQIVRGAKWYQVGLGQWISQEDLRVVTIPNSLPDGLPQGARWIRVDLEQQTATAFIGDTMVYATQISSGVTPYYTRPGLFQITKKLALQNMSGSFAADRSDYYFVEDVPWVMYFDRARALHGAYWHNNFGFPKSHGCVNLSDADAHWMFEWADLGTWVYVVDPSGKTPTDDNYYKDDAGSP